MQGRLLPKVNGRYQAFPRKVWPNEFLIASKLGLDLIEFIVDLDDIEANPLMNIDGLRDIKSVCSASGVGVISVCADFLMDAPLHTRDKEIAKKSASYLETLILNANALEISEIVVPCVDNSSIRIKEDKVRFIDAIERLVDLVEENKVNLSLETDLSPDQFASLLEVLQSPRITVNYDIGNSASLGYNSKEELNAYGHRISDIHIKDRLRDGGSVILGEGNADFEDFFNNLSRLNYQGPFIMQAFRDEEGIKIFENQLNWVLPLLRQSEK